MDPLWYINIGILIIATICNCLALQGAVLGEIAFKGYRCFLISLLVSDVYVIVVNFALSALQAVSFYYDAGVDLSQCAVVIVRRLGITGFVANLLNFSAMSADHFICLVFPIKYREMMKETTIIITVVAIWTVSLIAAFADTPIRAAMLSVTTSSSSQSSTATSVLPATLQAITPAISNILDSDDDNRLYNAFTKGRLSVTSNRWTAKNQQQADSAARKTTIMTSNNETTSMRPPTGRSNINSNVGQLLSENFIDQFFPEDTTSLCDGYFDPQYNLWLECISLALAFSAMTFLGVTCAVIFRGTLHAHDLTKQKLYYLVITTLILLCSFCFCWLPYICYEISIVFISQMDGDYIPESKTDYFLHNVLYSVFMLSQVAIPTAYIARNRAVQRQLVKQYGCLIPACIRNSWCLEGGQPRSSSSSNNRQCSTEMVRKNKEEGRRLIDNNNKRETANNNNNTIIVADVTQPHQSSNSGDNCNNNSYILLHHNLDDSQKKAQEVTTVLSADDVNVHHQSSEVKADDDLQSPAIIYV